MPSESVIDISMTPSFWDLLLHSHRLAQYQSLLPMRVEHDRLLSSLDVLGQELVPDAPDIPSRALELPQDDLEPSE